MIELIKTMFSYDFMVQAVVVGLLVTLCASLLGVSMVLKRYSMIGDGLSHVGFAALALATAFNTAPLKVAIPVCIVAAFFLLRISNNGKIKGDQAVALLCSGSLAVGVMILSLSSGMNTDVNNYMFGSILSISAEDALLTKILSIIVLIMFVLFFNRIFAVTFDENFAKATGTAAGVYNMILAVLTAVTVVIGMNGSTSDIKSCYFSESDINEGVQYLQRRCDELCNCGSHKFYDWHNHIVCIRNTYGCKYCMRGYSMFCTFWHCRSDKTKDS